MPPLVVSTLNFVSSYLVPSFLLSISLFSAYYVFASPLHNPRSKGKVAMEKAIEAELDVEGLVSEGGKARA
jgi:hypothetical protein